MEDVSAHSAEWVSWQQGNAELLSIRYAVFVDEQRVPVELEQDEHDPNCEHLLARNSRGTPVGTARLSETGKVGRLAVLRDFRRKGVGRMLMKTIEVRAGEKHLERLKLHAQEDSIPFYQTLGYEVEGERFMEAGIPHFQMSLYLA